MRSRQTGRCSTYLALRAEVEAVLPDEVLRLSAGGSGGRRVHHGAQLVPGHGVRLQVTVGHAGAQGARQVVVLQLQQVILANTGHGQGRARTGQGRSDR